MEKIALASDHAGFALKKLIEEELKEKGYDIVTFSKLYELSK